jgi:hypothetical protein
VTRGATPPVIAPLFDGPIDVVGDVHGEIEPLEALLAQLRYDDTGRHPEGRRLVFLGDLGDRGPDSPAVIERVRRLVEAGRAQCLLGNHELNLLRGESKPGNRWFIAPSHPEQQPGGEFAHCRVVPEALRAPWLDFFATLPVALERADVRIVHAAWVPAQIGALRQAAGSTLDRYQAFEAQTLKQLLAEGLMQSARAEEQRWSRQLHDRYASLPLLRSVGQCDERYQMGNPVRVATSGVERLVAAPFWSSGKWRMCRRVRWWDEYDEAVPVVIGHYWRQLAPIRASAHAAAKQEVFASIGPTEWAGRRYNVYCVDFSIGARYQERRAGVQAFATHLGAMRWPERELWLETGQVK